MSAAADVAARELAAVLRPLEIFKDVGDDNLLAVARAARVFTAYKGQTLVEEGEEGSNLLVVLKGRVQVKVECIVPFVEIGISSLCAGDVFGEIGLVERTPRTATVIATEPCDICEVSAEGLSKLFAENRELEATVMRNIARALAIKLRQMNRRLMTLMKNRFY